jgi:hypothetical protein
MKSSQGNITDIFWSFSGKILRTALLHKSFERNNIISNIDNETVELCSGKRARIWF